MTKFFSPEYKEKFDSKEEAVAYLTEAFKWAYGEGENIAEAYHLEWFIEDNLEEWDEEEEGDEALEEGDYKYHKELDEE